MAAGAALLTLVSSEVLFAPLLAIAVAVVGWRVALRRRASRRLTDDMIMQIEREGRVETAEREPLDLDEIRAEEDEFWNQTWDEPESL